MTELAERRTEGEAPEALRHRARGLARDAARRQEEADALMVAADLWELLPLIDGEIAKADEQAAEAATVLAAAHAVERDAERAMDGHLAAAAVEAEKAAQGDPHERALARLVSEEYGRDESRLREALTAASGAAVLAAAEAAKAQAVVTNARDLRAQCRAATVDPLTARRGWQTVAFAGVAGRDWEKFFRHSDEHVRELAAAGMMLAIQRAGAWPAVKNAVLTEFAAERAELNRQEQAADDQAKLRKQLPPEVSVSVVHEKTDPATGATTWARTTPGGKEIPVAAPGSVEFSQYQSYEPRGKPAAPGGV